MIRFLHVPSIGRYRGVLFGTLSLLVKANPSQRKLWFSCDLLITSIFVMVCRFVVGFCCFFLLAAVLTETT